MCTYFFERFERWRLRDFERDRDRLATIRIESDEERRERVYL